MFGWLAAQAGWRADRAGRHVYARRCSSPVVIVVANLAERHTASFQRSADRGPELAREELVRLLSRPGAFVSNEIPLWRETGLSASDTPAAACASGNQPGRSLICRLPGGGAHHGL